MIEFEIPANAWDCHFHVYGPWGRFPLPPAPPYTPDEAGFDALRQLHERLGIAHGVLVQPAVYGADHSALLAALRESGGAYRGIALIEPDIDDALLDEMHLAGVRGARLNVVSHLPGGTDPGRLRAIAGRVRSRGWHLLLHGALPQVLDALGVLAAIEVPVVVDHMARVPAARGIDYVEFAELEAHLARPEVWIKLSGADRISAGEPPFRDAVPIGRRLLSLAPHRALWGTDWPHPNITTPWPEESALLALLGDICEDRESWRRVLVENPAALYA
jgi:predicted TIM-barrel fold metal-dependent hydrolase